MAPNLQSKDYYEILGCSRNATDAQLKKAYRKLAVKWHPDKNPDNPEATTNFQKISEAFSVLSDEKKRKMYNQYGVDGVNAADQMGENGGGFPGGGGFGFPPGGFGGGSNGTFHHSMSSDDAQHLFSQFFGNDDPFGGPGMQFSMGGPSGMPFSSMRGGNGVGGGGMDPFSMMFGGGGGGMPGMGMGMPGMQFQQQRQTPPPAKQYDAIPSQTVVTLRGLVSASNKNGERGIIQQYNQSKGRYMVKLEDSDEIMSIKPNNLQQHVKARLYGIESKPTLNGKTGTILAWNATKERYNIYVTSNSQAMSLKPSNVILDNGTVGQIIGLQSKPQLNNKWGTIINWIKESKRYDVQLSATQIIRVKLDNIRV